MVSSRFFDVYLYYAMGGGLGHIMRTAAILSSAPSIARETRVLVNILPPAFLLDHCPAPIDTPPASLLNDRHGYYAFLEDYVERHDIRAIVIDTFPGGIVGELADLFSNIPRVLVARYLNPVQYAARLKGRVPEAPVRTLAIEPLDIDLRPLISAPEHTTALNGPLVHADCELGSKAAPKEQAVAVVHSQSGPELERLSVEAARYADRHGVDRIDIVAPHLAPVLFYRGCRNYTATVSGAGYNTVALCRLTKSWQHHILMSFARRFDDQRLRIRRYEERAQREETNQVYAAASWLTEALEVCG